MKTKFTNRLAREKSPYLLQHAHNPVDWHPWGTEAFEKARTEDKPIFLSVGYSTCHWCHVMERESFENETVAKILNAHFVSIKLDREERPDVDRVYMTFVQATTGAGGWPMNVFLTPGLEPFAGGTYFPPEDRAGRPGFAGVLLRIAEAWKNDRAKIAGHGEQMTASLREYTAAVPSDTTTPGAELLKNGCEQIARTFDPDEGGFGGAPKFPRPVTLHFLLRHFARSGDRHALEMALFTLRKMAQGGIHDHLGGGFHRYSVDRFWHVPHFEKMLYDQAQLALAYLDAFQITRDPFHAETARGILDYVLRDMTSPEGGFYSAEDADSAVSFGAEGHGEKAEGAFYVWTKGEIDGLLGSEAAEIFDRVYGVEAGGNAPDGSDPMGEFSGKNSLILRLADDEAARLFNRELSEIQGSLAESRRRLLEIRSRRPRPDRDDKIITAWNGLMISALARAAQVLGGGVYLDAATRAAQFAATHLVNAGGALLRSYREGPSNTGGFADDHAFLIQGLLDLHEAGLDPKWLSLARRFQERQDALFADEEHGGYFSVSANDPHLLFRAREDYDGAEPSPNSVSALNLLRLAQMTGGGALRLRAEKTVGAFTSQLRSSPHAMPQMLGALGFMLATPKQIVITGNPGATGTRALLRAAHARFIPDKTVQLSGAAGAHEPVVPSGGGPAAYVCENFSCRPPVSDPAALERLLAGEDKQPGYSFDSARFSI